MASPVGRGVRIPPECPAPLLEAARALAARYPGVPPVRRPEKIGATVRDHTGRRGIRTARAAADPVRVGSDSPAETRWRLLLEDHGVHGLILGHPLFDPAGNLVAQPDLALEEHRLSLRYEGSQHDGEGQRVIDIRRMRATEAVGWREVRICSEGLYQYVVTTQGPVPVAVALVWAAMGAARRR